MFFQITTIICFFVAVYYAYSNSQLYKRVYSIAEDVIKLEDLIDKATDKVIAEEESWKMIQLTEIDEPMIFEFLKEYKNTLKAVRFEKIKRPASFIDQGDSYFKFSVKFIDKQS